MNSREKGKRIEREAVHQVHEHWFAGNCIRAAQANGAFSADLLDAGPNLHVEVKGRNRLAVMEFMRQAEKDAGPGQIPIVLMRENRDRDFVVMFRIQNSLHFAAALAANIGAPIPPAYGQEKGASHE